MKCSILSCKTARLLLDRELKYRNALNVDIVYPWQQYQHRYIRYHVQIPSLTFALHAWTTFVAIEDKKMRPASCT